jgi:hypothetical protein
MTNLASGCAPTQPLVHGGLQASPDALRLLSAIIPSGIAIGSPAAAFMGNHWRTGTITATGLTSVELSVERHGRCTVHDRRNLLVGDEHANYQKALRKWLKDHKQEILL